MSSSAPSQQDLKQQGNVHFQNDEFEKAIDFYTQAINLDPAGDPTVPILSNRSLCYYNIKKYKEAYEDAGCCCGLKPDWAKGFARRGFAAMKLEEYEIALESFDEYLKLNGGKDEMDVRKDRNFMNKLMTAKRKRQEETLRSLQSFEKDLQNISDPDERHAEACALFYNGHNNFPEHMERMRIAAKYCRLDTPVRLGQEIDLNFGRPILSTFAKDDVDRCRAQLHNDSLSEERKYPYTTLIHQTIFRIFNPYRRTPAESVVCFDFLCDLVENDEEDYSPLAAEGDNDSKLEMKKREVLMSCVQDSLFSCFEDKDFDSGEVFSKGNALDVTLTLLHRGKQLIFGKKTQMSDKEYATRLFREYVTLLLGRDYYSPSWHRETVQACLALLDAKADVNGIIPHSGLTQLNTLHQAINCESESRKLVELFIRYGADLSYLVNIGAFTPLDTALALSKIDLAELIYTRGGKLGSRETPKWALKKMELLSDPSLLKPRCIVFQNQMNLESVRTLFNMMLQQDLSFYCLTSWRDTNELLTPLTFAILHTLYGGVKLIDLIVELKPSLVFAPVLRRTQTESPTTGKLKSRVSKRDVLVFLAAHSSGEDPTHHVASFENASASLISRGGFDFETAYKEHETKTGKSNYPFVDMEELTDREKKLQEYLWQLARKRKDVVKNDDE